MRRFAAFILAALVFSASCNYPSLKKPWRDFSLMPFSEEKWRAGDPLESGRMFRDLREKTEGKSSREEMLKLLGEPDEITQEKGEEYIWYYTEHAGRRGLLKRPISFNPQNKAVFGIDQ